MRKIVQQASDRRRKMAQTRGPCSWILPSPPPTTTDKRSKDRMNKASPTVSLGKLKPIWIQSSRMSDSPFALEEPVRLTLPFHSSTLSTHLVLQLTNAAPSTSTRTCSESMACTICWPDAPVKILILVRKLTNSGVVMPARSRMLNYQVETITLASFEKKISRAS